MNSKRKIFAALALHGVCVSVWVGSPVYSQDSKPAETSGAVSTSALKAVSAPEKVAPSVAGGTTTAVSSEAALDFPGKTVLDDPGASDPRLIVPVDAEGKVVVGRLSKIDLDGDLDYDGTIDNTSSSDQGQIEFLPPGLELGVGEVTRLVVRFKTYEQEFPGQLIVALEVSGVNRDSSTGVFDGNGESSVGRVRVWRDQARKELLVDSGDKNKLRHEWRYDPAKRLGGIPRTLYVEGVSVSPKFEGDIRLLLSASQVSDGADINTPSSLYQAAFDHVLVTVREKPVEKEFVNNNAEGVWSTTAVETKPAETKPAEASAAEGSAAPQASR